MLVPVSGNGFEGMNDVLRRSEDLTIERPALQQALNRLGHVEPTARQRGEHGQNAARKAPTQPVRGVMTDQVVQDEQDAQGWQDGRQARFDTDIGAPAFPQRAVNRRRVS